MMKAEMQTLDQLPVGSSARITAMSCTGLARRRLMDLGILPGVTITAEMRSPLGDPVAYRVRGSMIALRAGQAAEIQIEPVEQS